MEHTVLNWPSYVIPAQAGIHVETEVAPLWIPAFARMTR